jgi:hypothetical protein
MSDAASTAGASDAVLPGATCANCRAALHGPFCAACGQESKPLDPPVRYFAREFAQELFEVDGRVPGSLRRLVFSPGYLTRAHLEGRRAPWLSPLKLYLLTSVAAFAVSAFAGAGSGLRIAITGDAGQPVDAAALGFANEAEIAAAIDAARPVWIPRAMFVLVPIFGWLVALVRRSVRRRYPSHLVFALHVHAAAFAVWAATTAIGPALPAPGAALLAGLVPLYLLGYLPMAFRAVYGGTWLRAVSDTMVVGVIYWIVVLSVVGGVVIGAAVLSR